MIPGLFFFFWQITRSLVQKWYLNDVFHQIAIAIGVLTSNTRKANRFGGLDVALGCYGRWLTGEGDDQLCLGESTWCHCWVPF